MINENIFQVFSKLDALIAQKGADESYAFVICGGAALLSLGIVDRSTMDIDVLDPEIPPRLADVAATLGEELGGIIC